MKYRGIALYCLLLIACGKPLAKVDVGPFAMYLQKYDIAYEKVFAHSRTQIDLVIEFGLLEEDELAVCESGLGRVPTVIVNTRHWAELSIDEKEITIMHELGHCIEGRAHDNNPGVGRQWESVMEEYPQDMEDYALHRDEYLMELLTSRVSTPDYPNQQSRSMT